LTLFVRQFRYLNYIGTYVSLTGELLKITEDIRLYRYIPTDTVKRDDGKKWSPAAPREEKKIRLMKKKKI